ncbi:uncharacterized protein ACNLHF_027165 [Anomaloglossus baeobatrachus]
MCGNYRRLAAGARFNPGKTTNDVKRKKFDANVANYKDFFTELKEISKKVGCSIDEILGTDGTVGGLGIKGPLSDVLCKLMSKALLSDCLANMHANLVPERITKVNKLLCKSDYKALSADDLIQFFKQVACFGDDALGTKDALETLASGLGDTAAPLLQDLLTTLVGLLQELFPGGIPGLGCTLLNIGNGGAGGVLGGTLGVAGGLLGAGIGGAGNVLGAKAKLF